MGKQNLLNAIDHLKEAKRLMSSDELQHNNTKIDSVIGSILINLILEYQITDEDITQYPQLKDYL